MIDKGFSVENIKRDGTQARILNGHQWRHPNSHLTNVKSWVQWGKSISLEWLQVLINFYSSQGDKYLVL